MIERLVKVKTEKLKMQIFLSYGVIGSVVASLPGPPKRRLSFRSAARNLLPLTGLP